MGVCAEAAGALNLWMNVKISYL